MDQLSHLEVELLAKKAKSELYALYRNSSLAVLNSGAVTDDLDSMLDAAIEGKMMPEQRQAFRKKFVGACDGRSTEKICRWIFGEL